MNMGVSLQLHACDMNEREGGRERDSITQFGERFNHKRQRDSITHIGEIQTC